MVKEDQLPNELIEVVVTEQVDTNSPAGSLNTEAHLDPGVAPLAEPEESVSQSSIDSDKLAHNGEDEMKNKDEEANLPRLQ